MSRRSSIVWAVSITFLLLLAFPDLFRAIGESISTSIEDLRDGPLPEQGDPPIDLGPGRVLVEFSDKTSHGATSLVAFAPDGKSVVASWDEEFKAVVALFDTATGKVRWRIAPESSRTCGVAFAPDGRTLAVGTDQAIKLLDAENGGERSSMGGLSESRNRLAYSADGRRLIVANTPLLAVRDTASGKEITSFHVSTMRLGGVAISPDGRTYAAAGSGPMSCRPIGLFGMGGVGCGPKGGRVWLWDSEAAGDPRVFETRGMAYDVAFSSDGQTLASASYEGVRLWNLAEGKGRKIVDDRACALAYSPDGLTLAIGTGTPFDDDKIGEIRLWDVTTRRTRSVMRCDLGTIRSVAFAPDGGSVVAGAARGIALWSLPAEPPGG